MQLIATTLADMDEVLGGDDDIACECMLCHLPENAEHGPVEWRLTWTWPGPYPMPGTSSMLMCDACFHDWIDHPKNFGGRPVSAHRV